MEDPPEEADLPDDTADDESKPPRSRKGKFLEFVEEKVDKNNSIQVERLEHLKVQLRDHLRVTRERKTRSRTNSKRKKDSSKEEGDQQSSRPRTISPSPQ